MGGEKRRATIELLPLLEAGGDRTRLRSPEQNPHTSLSPAGVRRPRLLASD
uniref:Uncharacterized protein n=1 Tax=Arundo donax TaxID=35708 RepID=A0A0A8ZK22_ARUDO